MNCIYLQYNQMMMAYRQNTERKFKVTSTDGSVKYVGSVYGGRTPALITYPSESTYSACIFCKRSRRTKRIKPLKGFFFFFWVNVPPYCALRLACHHRGKTVVAGRHSLHSLQIRENIGNHFQLPSSDYFGTMACHCEMGLGFTVARKTPITALCWNLPRQSRRMENQRPVGGGGGTWK